MTAEDPVESRHGPGTSIVWPREVVDDVPSFAPTRAQRALPLAEERGRVPAVELRFSNDAIRHDLR